MNYYAKNIEALRRRNPQLAAGIESMEPLPDAVRETARNGEPTAKIDGIYLHSPYDPTKEANEWAGRAVDEKVIESGRGPKPTVLGFGLGYHLRALLRHGVRGTVIEPVPGIIKLAMECCDLTGVIEGFDLLAGVSPGRLHRAFGDLLSGEILAHPSSLRVQSEYLGKLKGYSDALRDVKKGGLKIVVVNPIYGGSLPAAQHCARALRRMGHKVITFDSNLFAEGMKLTGSFEYNESKRCFQSEFTSFLSKGVELMVRETMPDMVLALAQAPLTPETLQTIDRAGIPTAFWFVEDFRVLTYWRDMAPYYSYFFGIQDGVFQNELGKIGVTNYSYLPTAAAPDIHCSLRLSKDEKKEFGSPLSFVGAGYFNRQIFFKGLVDYPFKIWGSDWPLLFPLAPLIQRNASRIDTTACVKIFNASDINLNLHSSTHQVGVVSDGDFVNPRTFEIACCGAFQLVDRRSHMADLFSDNEMENFSDITELRDKIDHYLDDEPGRAKVVEKARKRVLAEHTYEKRMEELITIMVSSFPHLAGRHRGRLKQRLSILGELDDHAGLGELLERMPGGQWFALEDVYRNITVGKETVSRAEKIFLALQHVEAVREAVPR